MKIRQAEIEDARLLSRLCVHVQQLHAEAYPSLFKLPVSDDFALAFFEMILDDPNAYAFIVEDPQPAGYLVCRVMHSEGNPFMNARSFLYIDQISVEPEFQGKGFGKSLLARAAQLAEEENLSSISLDSWAFNQEAHAFFQSQDYEIFNVRMWKR